MPGVPAHTHRVQPIRSVGIRLSAPSSFIPNPLSSRRISLKLPPARASVSRFQTLFYASTEDYRVDASQLFRTRSTSQRVAERPPAFKLSSVLFERGLSHNRADAIVPLLSSCNKERRNRFWWVGGATLKGLLQIVSPWNTRGTCGPRSPPTFMEYDDIEGRVDASVSDLARYRQHVPIQVSSPPRGGTKNDQ